jgi:hypothetical protein
MHKARAVDDAILIAKTILAERPAAYFGDMGSAPWRALTPAQRILSQIPELETYVRVADAIGVEPTRRGARARALELALMDARGDLK